MDELLIFSQDYSSFPLVFIEQLQKCNLLLDPSNSITSKVEDLLAKYKYAAAYLLSQSIPHEKIVLQQIQLLWEGYFSNELYQVKQTLLEKLGRKDCLDQLFQLPFTLGSTGETLFDHKINLQEEMIVDQSEKENTHEKSRKKSMFSEDFLLFKNTDKDKRKENIDKFEQRCQFNLPNGIC